MTALVFLAAMLMQSPGGEQECSIVGHVYSTSTGAPLKKAQVRLSGQGVNRRLTESVNTTDAEGSFRFDHLAMSQYGLVADRSGYINSSTSLITCGTTDVTIKMMPQSMISGKVIDDDGEPVANAFVTVYRRAWFRGQKQLQQVQGGSSQADGTFTLGNLVSDNYYVSAKGSLRPPSGEAFVDNYFPNTPDVRAAVSVNVMAGMDVRGLDLRVRIARVYNVHGSVARANGEPVTGIPLMLIHMNGPNRGSTSAGTQGGVFEFHDVSPGNYMIQALPFRNGDTNSTSMLTTYMPLTVGEGDVQDLHVTLSAGAEIAGGLTLDNEPFSQNVSISLEPLDEGGFGNNAQVKDGVFAMHHLAPTRFRVAIQNLLDGYYVKSIRFAGRALVRRELDLSAGMDGTLEIQLAAKPAAINGIVRSPDGEPVAGAVVNVWTRDDPEIRAAHTDESGHFTLHNFAPGEYRAIAWEAIERGLIENPTFRGIFDGRATVATLQEGSQENVELKLVPKSAIDVEVAKLP